MADPATIGAAIKAAAKSKIGAKIIDAIADGIFGKNKEFPEVKSELKKLDEKLDSLIVLSRTTLEIVEKLPGFIEDTLVRQQLFQAHNKIQSTIEAFYLLNDWHDTIGFDALQSTLEAWNAIVEKETRTEELIRLPRYGEFLLVLTNGQLIKPVVQGVREKKQSVEATIEAKRSDELMPLLNEANALIGSPHIRSGELLSQRPWVTWVRAANRTKTVKRYICRYIGNINGEHCYEVPEQVPDEAWNSSVASKDARLHAIQPEIDRVGREIATLSTVREVLDTYLLVAETYDPEGWGIPHMKVVESSAVFPIEAAG